MTTTLRQDLDWADRQWRRSVLSSFARWLRGEDDLAESVAPFVQAVCTRKRLDRKHTNRLSIYIMTSYLPSLRKRRASGTAPETADLLWEELVEVVLQAADRNAEEQQERPYAEIDEADRTMLRESDDPTLDFLERHDRELAADSLADDELQRMIAEDPKLFAEWNGAQAPIYELIRQYPTKYRMLVALWAVMGRAAFEEFCRTFTGETLTIPSDRDLRAVEETKTAKMLRLQAEGKTQAQIADHFGITQSAVAQRFKTAKVQRRDTWGASYKSFLKALSVAFNLMVRVRTRIRLHMGDNK